VVTGRITWGRMVECTPPQPIRVQQANLLDHSAPTRARIAPLRKMGNPKTRSLRTDNLDTGSLTISSLNTRNPNTHNPNTGNLTTDNRITGSQGANGPRTRRPVLRRSHPGSRRTGRRLSMTSTPRNCLGDRTPAGSPTRLRQLQPRTPLRRSTPRQQRPPARVGRPTSLIRIPGTPSQPAPKRLIGMLPTNRRPRTRPTPALTRAKPSTPSPMSICLGSP